jgi:hypothetical protein
VPIILATQEAEIRRIAVQSQPRKTVLKPDLEKTHHKKRAGGDAQVVENLPSKHKALSSSQGTKKKLYK